MLSYSLIVVALLVVVVIVALNSTITLDVIIYVLVTDAIEAVGVGAVVVDYYKLQIVKMLYLEIQ